jgi:hypothetical protein
VRYQAIVFPTTANRRLVTWNAVRFREFLQQFVVASIILSLDGVKSAQIITDMSYLVQFFTKRLRLTVVEKKYIDILSKPPITWYLPEF